MADGTIPAGHGEGDSNRERRQMTREEFAIRVVSGGDSFGAGSVLDDLLAFVKELIPVLLELFQNCPASTLKEQAEKGRGLRYRLGLMRVNWAIRDRMEPSLYSEVGPTLAESFACQCGCCTEQELEDLLQSAA